MNKLILTFAIIISMAGSLWAQDKTNEVQWKSFEEVEALMKKEPKRILIDLYTDWCGWCKRMDKATYSHPDVIRYINDHFYAVKFNAEQKTPVTFNGKEYKFKPELRAHEIAAELMQGRMSYPTTVILEADMLSISPIPGYMEPKDMESILKYLNDGRMKNITWEDWQKSFKPTWVKK